MKSFKIELQVIQQVYSVHTVEIQANNKAAAVQLAMTGKDLTEKTRTKIVKSEFINGKVHKITEVLN